MIRCICINDKNRPAEIPARLWVTEGELYHITFVAFCLPQKTHGVSLYEKPLDESCMPHEYFRMDRFAILREDLDLFIQLCKDCSDLDDLVVEDLVKESVMVEEAA